MISCAASQDTQGSTIVSNSRIIVISIGNEVSVANWKCFIDI